MKIVQFNVKRAVYLLCLGPDQVTITKSCFHGTQLMSRNVLRQQKITIKFKSVYNRLYQSKSKWSYIKYLREKPVGYLRAVMRKTAKVNPMRGT